MGSRTPLFSEHERLGARIVPFGGWDMPLHYGSQLDEHHAVRQNAGVFDVSHMRPVDIQGEDALSFLQRLLANDVAKLKQPGKALYSCMLNADGGVIDDLICYYLGPDRYRVVVNAGTADKDLAWMRDNAQGSSVNINSRDDLAMLAVQGPQARAKTAALLPDTLREPALALKPFFATEHGDWLVGRTGYTGEDGFELMLPATDVVAVWQALVAADVVPCGLGARDTLRLEAGMNLYGQDMTEEVGPLESGLGWTIAFEPQERDFIGRAALEAQRSSGELRDFVGLLLTGRGVLRSHQPVLRDGQPIGEVTSGGFSPTLQRSIALARVQAGIGEQCAVEIRGKAVPACVVKPPFVRQGEARIGLE
ncbi:glycine cleavage system aminomethyltransferase GcvT [Lamprobacter modestohalophilus]|uniref:glycine cleavage system aminomethyltransferase GcvT n=1 Tax=Lamprobacter modestohalophilus TaxID=1064514 RepID=UPI002ADEA79A|nr:glycine cleavage system aminomethyltransferase GcvT [Lamprobacter modestohalophilus]MEA1048343.1 glycine cleavage system aminomethyltransferase GcvT [Lamprobacter modestohalophilus]